MKLLSEVVAFFNQGVDAQRNAGADACSVNVRFMGSSGWTAHLMNVYWFNRTEKEIVVGRGQTGEEAVIDLIRLLAQNEVFRLGAELDTKGVTLKLVEAVENDVYEPDKKCPAAA